MGQKLAGVFRTSLVFDEGKGERRKDNGTRLRAAPRGLERRVQSVLS